MGGLVGSLPLWTVVSTRHLPPVKDADEGAAWVCSDSDVSWQVPLVKDRSCSDGHSRGTSRRCGFTSRWELAGTFHAMCLVPACIRRFQTCQDSLSLSSGKAGIRVEDLKYYRWFVVASMLQDKRNGVFVCYRREDSGYAGRLYDRLSDRFPHRIFFDVTDILLGENFVETIRRAINASRVLIVVIGKNWLSATDPDGHRRLDQAQDFVRIEIATALERGLELLPVLLPGAVMPRAEELPGDIAPLAYHQARAISDADFDYDVDSISDALAKALGPSRGRRYVRHASIVLAALTLVVAGALASYFFNLRRGSGSQSGPTRAPVVESRQDSTASANPSVRPGEPLTKPDLHPRPDGSGRAPVVNKRTPPAEMPSSTSARVEGLWFAAVEYWGGRYDEWAFEFHSTGSSLVGTAGGWDGDRSLLEGRIEGDWILFRTVWKNRPTYGGGPGGQTTYRDWWTDYRGQVDGKSIQLVMQRDEARPFKFTAYRREAVPQIERFAASTETVARGAAVNLCYRIRYAARITIEPSVGSVARTGDNCVAVRPTATTEFVLRAVSAEGVEQRQTAKVVVNEGAPLRF